MKWTPRFDLFLMVAFAVIQALLALLYLVQTPMHIGWVIFWAAAIPTASISSAIAFGKACRPVSDDDHGLPVPASMLKMAREEYPNELCEYSIQFGYFDGELDISCDNFGPISRRQPKPVPRYPALPRCGHETPQKDCISCRTFDEESPL